MLLERSNHYKNKKEKNVYGQIEVKIENKLDVVFGLKNVLENIVKVKIINVVDG